MRIWSALAVVILATVCSAAVPESGTNVFENPTPPSPQTDLDKIVFAHLARYKIQPVLCSDAVFIRRAYVDVLGTLPTAREARQFIEDSDPEKRKLLIEQLLQRPEFNDYWAMRWGDILRIKAEFPVNLWPNAAQAYHRWVHASLAANKPYDQFVRELLTSSGSNFRVGPVNFYRAIQNRNPEGIARAIALTFLGCRAESWPSNKLAGLAAFFSQIGYKPTSEWKEEHVFWDPLGSSLVAGDIAPGRAAVVAIGNPTNLQAAVLVPARTNALPTEGVFPDGTTAKLTADRDPRELFADWLIRPDNPWFSRNIVNRVWAWLLGRGIIHEPDDIRDDNPPANPELLAYLEKKFTGSGYNLRELFRLILNSQTYQLSPVPHGEPIPNDAKFAVYNVRRLDAEVLIDGINKITGSSDLYTSPIPEPFTYIPKGIPAVAIADGSITSPFLVLFGRSARATGMENERNHNPTPAQALYLLNSTDVQRKLEQGTNMQAVLGFGGRRPVKVLEDLYLTVLSRFPTAEEIKIIEPYGGQQGRGRRPAGKAATETTQGSTNVITNVVAASSTSVETTNKALTAPASSNLVASADGSTNAPVRRGRPIGSLGERPKTNDKAATGKSREDWIDVAWALINSEEFLYRH